MSADLPVDRDERTTTLENVGYRWAYSLLAYALLIDVAARSLLRHEQPWDLLGLVIVGGIIMGAYLARQGLWTRKSTIAVSVATFASLVIAAVAAILIALLR